MTTGPSKDTIRMIQDMSTMGLKELRKKHRHMIEYSEETIKEIEKILKNRGIE